MTEQALPDDPRRLKALNDLGMLYTPAEERFDRITRLTARVLDAPAVSLSLIDADTEWFKSRHGMDWSEIPRDISLAAHVIERDDTLVVRDARQDRRFQRLPLVTGNAHVCFFAAQPLHSEEGFPVGALCVMDSEPRELSDDDIANLRSLAGWAETELRIRVLDEAQTEMVAEREALMRRSLIDPLTNLWNRQGIEDLLLRELERARRESHHIAMLVADVDACGDINQSYSRAAGDEAIVEIGRRLRSGLRPYDAIGRSEGGRYIAILPNCDADIAGRVAERIRERVAANPIEALWGHLQITVSIGAVSVGPEEVADPNVLANAAEVALLRAKERGRNRVEIGQVF